MLIWIAKIRTSPILMIVNSLYGKVNSNSLNSRGTQQRRTMMMPWETSKLPSIDRPKMQMTRSLSLRTLSRCSCYSKRPSSRPHSKRCKSEPSSRLWSCSLATRSLNARKRQFSKRMNSSTRARWASRALLRRDSRRHSRERPGCRRNLMPSRSREMPSTPNSSVCWTVRGRTISKNSAISMERVPVHRLNRQSSSYRLKKREPSGNKRSLSCKTRRMMQ